MSTLVHNMNICAKSSLEIRADRLDSWKQIAVYLDRDVRTVQRWETREDLPVHRQIHVKASTVWAFKGEIDAWFKNRCQVLSKPIFQKHGWDQQVNWSSPTVLMARKLGNSCWSWLVVAPGSDRFDGHPSVVTGDENEGAERL